MNATAVTRYSGPIAIIDLTGRVSLADGLVVMRDAIQQEIRSGYKHLLLNLAGVTYMDSAGLGEMASAYIKLNSIGGKVKLMHAQDKVYDLLRLTRLSALLVTYSDEAEAIASFGVR